MVQAIVHLFKRCKQNRQGCLQVHPRHLSPSAVLDFRTEMQLKFFKTPPQSSLNQRMNNGTDFIFFDLRCFKKFFVLSVIEIQAMRNYCTISVDSHMTTSFKNTVSIRYFAVVQ